VVWDFTLLWAIADVGSWLGASILLIAGALKVANPLTATKFLHRLRFRAPALTVRVIAVAELAGGAAVLVGGGRAALAAAAALYAAFLISILVHRATTGESAVSCGCFGSATVIKVVPHAVALGIALAATAAVLAGSRAAFVTVCASLTPTQVVLLVALLCVTLLILTGAALSPSGESPGKATPAPALAEVEKTVTFEVLSISGK
jgi:uncharacterized membrane protein YphA (DoxX/SURF4 family)